MVPTIEGVSPRAERSEARQRETRRALARRVARAMTREARHDNSFN